MNDTGDITQNRQEDVYQEISTTAALQEDPQGWDEDGEDDFANVRASDSHLSVGLGREEQCSSGMQPV